MDWGLGHVSRTIPVIKNLLKRGHTVITCGNENIKTIYKVWPELTYDNFTLGRNI